MYTSSPLVARINMGGATERDAEWLEYLDRLFADVPIHGFVEVGMDAAAAREFLGILALARRVVADDAA